MADINMLIFIKAEKKLKACILHVPGGIEPPCISVYFTY